MNFSEQMQMIEQNITIHVNQSGKKIPHDNLISDLWVVYDAVLEMELERLNETVMEQRNNITNSTREVHTHMTRTHKHTHTHTHTNF